ncbi:hypothetical protein U1Q18_005561 [Sarracenia purpurea var. burkii]
MGAQRLIFRRVIILCLQSVSQPLPATPAPSPITLTGAPPPSPPSDHAGPSPHLLHPSPPVLHT